MHTPKRTPGRAATRRGRGDVVERDSREDKPAPKQDQGAAQVSHLIARFGLSRPHAKVIAALLYAEAA